MQRIEAIEKEKASGKQRELLEKVEKSLGRSLKMTDTMAQAPEVLEAYLTCGQLFAQGKLSAALREQIAVAVAGADRCEYCASAHTAIGRRLKISDQELRSNLLGESADPRTRAILEFVRAVITSKGFVNDESLEKVRRAGCSDQEIVEIVANTALNIFTNYFNLVAQTEVDFPLVEVAGAGITQDQSWGSEEDF